MKIGIISDIHGNAPALRQILKRLAPLADRILFCGDLVGYMPCTDDIFDMILKHNIVCIQGNHDYLLSENVESANSLVREGIDISKRTVKTHNIAMLKGLPMSLSLEFDNIRIKMMHGGPRDMLNEYVYPNSPSICGLSTEGMDFVLLGHTHVPMIRRINNTTIINPGSVGLPRDADPRASYAIIDTETQGRVEICRQIYDLDITAQTIEMGTMSEVLLEYLYLGCQSGDFNRQGEKEEIARIAEEIKDGVRIGDRVHEFSKEVFIECADSLCAIIAFPSTQSRKEMIVRTTPFCHQWTDGFAKFLNERQNSNCHENYDVIRAGHGLVLVKRIDLHENHCLREEIANLRSRWQELRDGFSNEEENNAR